MNVLKDRFVGLHLALTMGLEARALTDFRRELVKTYIGAARAYEKGGDAGLKAVMNKHREEVYYLLSSLYSKATPLYGRLILRQIKSAVPTYETKSSLSSSEEDFFSLLSSRWIISEGVRRASSISQTTLNDIREILDDGIQQGLSIPEISKGIRGLGGEFSGRRARTIAITEVHSASMFASIETAKATQLTLIKEWASVEDSRVRPTHAAADGQRREMNDKFSVGGAKMDRPSDPEAPASEVINCRCALLYHERETAISDE